MTRPTLVVDQICAITPDDMPAAQLKDIVLSLVFANAAARAQRNSDPDNSVDAFRNGWLGAMGNLGWVVTTAGTANLSLQSRGDTTTVAARIRMNAPDGASEAVLDQLQALTDEPSDADARRLLDMWWTAGTMTRPFYGGLAMINAASDSIVLKLTQFAVDLDTLAVCERGFLRNKTEPLQPTSPAGFFDTVLASSIKLSVYQISCELDLAKFATRRAELVAKLGDKIDDHFTTLPATLLGEAR